MYPFKKNNLSKEEKIDIISSNFENIMKTLWLDLNDDSLKKTPHRVAKMYVNEIFKWLDDKNYPSISTFENKYKYNQMLIVKNIKIMSACEHHFVPFIWQAFIAYIPKKKVIWLSKINRIVDFYSRKPQVQERLTEEIYRDLVEKLWTEDIAIMINAVHYCVVMRWVEDINSNTTTSKMGWVFLQDNNARKEFLSLCK